VDLVNLQRIELPDQLVVSLAALPIAKVHHMNDLTFRLPKPANLGDKRAAIAQCRFVVFSARVSDEPAYV